VGAAPFAPSQQTVRVFSSDALSYSSGLFNPAQAGRRVNAHRASVFRNSADFAKVARQPAFYFLPHFSVENPIFVGYAYAWFWHPVHPERGRERSAVAKGARPVLAPRASCVP
jgi:hypothetical protein